MSTKAYKWPALLVFLTLLPWSVSADFSHSQAVMHPQFPGTGPFIIEIRGTWPTDCHPGEQKPVVESFDGHRVEIEFETIVVHITCNTRDTEFRVLVDLSDTIRKTTPLGQVLDIQVSFGDATLTQSLDLFCPSGSDCSLPTVKRLRPEPGLYQNPNLANQGLVVVRQNTSMAIFPLAYDEFGTSEWLFTGNQMVEDSFFTGILLPVGGDCFGCEPGYSQPELTPIGYLSVLVDQPGLLLVKVNDSLFVEYRRLVFGYKSFRIGPAGEHALVDLAGRWGIIENHGTKPPLGDLTEFLPGAFDIVREEILTTGPGIMPDGQVSYRISTLTGAFLGQLVCKGQTSIDNSTNMCEFIDPSDASEPLFLFYQDGPSSLSIEYGHPVIAVGNAPGGRAVRLE